MTPFRSKLKTLLCVGVLLSFFLQVFALPESGVTFEQNQKVTLAHHHHDHTPDSHQHCDHCSMGICCADIGESFSIVGPNLQVKKYLNQASFWFYKLISSQLRPPAVLS